MSKIILSFGTLGQGGAAQVCANLSFRLCDVYDEVILVTWADYPQFNKVDPRATHYCVEKEVGRNDWNRLRWFRALVKSEKPDLILSFLEPYNLRVLVSTIGLHIPTIVCERNDPHGVNKYWIMDLIEKTVYHLADGILVQTPTIKKFFNGMLARRTKIIYNPVNVDTELVGAALDIPKKKRIVSLARLKKQKNHDVLIMAFAKFVESHPDYTLTIYGNGPERLPLQKLAARLGLSDKVFLPGASQTAHLDILDANMMCLVSSREGMSNSMIESMCLGLPCVCTKVSGAVDLIEDGQNGFLVDIGNVDQLADKMTHIADDSELAQRVGRKATELYQILNKDKIYKEWLEYLENITQC